MWLVSFTNVLVVLIGAVTLLYWYVKHRFAFWRKKGVPDIEPHWLFGNLGELILGKISLPDLQMKWYKTFEGKRYGGIYEFHTPIMVILDPQLLREVMSKDFDAWSSRGLSTNKEVDPLAMHLVNLDGSMWKSIRSKLTPTFTSGKLKQMHHLLVECGDTFEKYLSVIAAKNEPIEARELSAKFTTDVIGSCAFGLQMNALGDDNSEFRNMGRKIFQPTLKKTILNSMQRGLPKVYKLLKIAKIASIPQEVTDFFMGIITDTIAYREANNIQRHDFLDLLRSLKNTGEQLAEGEVEFDDQLLAAQAFVFFAAGFETSSTVMSYCFHELAVNQDVQDRLREEIHRQKAEDNGEITWDGMKKMKYLHMVLQESLRKYPPVPMLPRTSVKPYRIPDTNIDLPAGMSCFVPVYAIHHDPTYYPEPEKFDPLRFTEENEASRPPMTFLPFGAGPRFCIGSRFAEQQSKLGILKMIDKFKLSLCDKSQIKLEHSPKAALLVPKSGIWLKITPI